MNTLEDLPVDQRAVVELVLRSGRSYDQIAAILKIDRAAVRQRALAGLDSLAPEWGPHLPEARRALITDYLLGQLPPRLSEQVRERLAREDADRAWAQTVAGALAPIASGPLPEIPEALEVAAVETEDAAPPPAPAPGAGAASQGAAPRGVLEPGPQRSSLLGGAILLVLGAVVAIAVIVTVVILVSSGGGSSSKHSSTTTAHTSPSTSSSTTPTASTSTTSKPLTLTILSATSSASKAKGAAEVIREKGTLWLFLVATNLPPNSHNYYVVWLTNGPTDSKLIGFAQPVTSTGRLAAFAPGIQLSYGRFKHMVVTLETTQHPKAPGPVVLSGAFNLK